MNLTNSDNFGTMYLPTPRGKTMESIEPKKASLIRILHILQKHSDIEHPLTHAQIVEMLEKDYGIIIERKVVGRTIALLNDVGYEIVTTQKGCYLAEQPFEDSELRLLIDSVLSSKHIAPKHSKQLIEKLCGLSNQYFRRHVKNIYSVNDWDKTENVALFYNIDIIDEAIEKKQKIRFYYNKYGADKKLHTSSRNTVSPYQMILHNQKYYLMCFAERYGQMHYYRLDRITGIELVDEPQTPVRSIEGYENGIDYKRFNSQLPYMFADDPITVEFLAEGWVIDQVVDWLGRDITITQQGERFLVRVKVSKNAMEYWALQYVKGVEILSPVDLREKIADTLGWAAEKYKKLKRE